MLCKLSVIVVQSLFSERTHMNPKLILVEGIPGSGKTNSAHFVAEWLKGQGVDVALFLEGNLAHPADFESVACLSQDEYSALKAAFPADAELLDRHVVEDHGDYFCHYRQLEQDVSEVAAPLIAALARYEIYVLPVVKWKQVIRRRWQRFAAAAAHKETVYVFECCFLQNPLTMLLGRNDEPVGEAGAFVLELATAIQILEPALIYLHPDDVRKTLTKAAQERPAQWLNSVIAYHTQQGHGLAQGWQGFDGLVMFYEMRRQIELDLLAALPFAKLLVEHSTWAENHERIATFLAQHRR